ncbi:MAG: tRNA uridine(34) 5-carboxymethylaminomethyl modification radical SAM/GNAT enzyme Elp3 [Chloroflexi bacterium]|nr:tRNA uridine(34) 5-carboxymethylaminomethyl modification radical SAM/GNAT enzyme Elp3 [Chloroflexota bacterium]MCI0578473.1 tRNA uridine(34) 5-carboxymethylaminomethyl modification radical SAM/GNAT enzyme Elp3 [Chloroflexota bacterium]MCI0643919.1 tRNA uridine(34) 5-carboxymethylaminomethyl modification radical SAM/GNAT enzyme Elp3 [Chloroflexota bacterium]MCI0729171.1 tRNA uridine(34) 5-carboxymethylaminomethyl modification radical SAM/GNAT enzyme Elp3 [Chloroflexota bacterium]
MMEAIPIDDVRLARWRANHRPVAIAGRERELVGLIEELLAHRPLKGAIYNRIMHQYVRGGLPWLSKSQLVQAYQELCHQGWLAFDPDTVTALQMKPTRSQAGVTVVTVLTKPYPCPGKCIFCPTDVRMPKSYLHDEPGAMRAERHAFDPYAQTLARIQALESIGHPADKIELLILGGTWSSYRRDYQEWFVKRCLDALNGVEAGSLAEAQAINAVGTRRNVGLVVETRPDHVDAEELRWFRTLGVTKVQIGLQSLDDRILALNRRGETVQDGRDAIRLLRLAGFKIHAHWMPNLLGATPDSDVADFGRLWRDPAFRPDELKIYPCMLLENAELYGYWQRGEYRPYTEEEVIEVLVACKAQVPAYVRINRVIRDIPTTNVVEGFKKANLRQVAQQRLRERGLQCRCIRCREVRRQPVNPANLCLLAETYETDATTEHFLSFETAPDHDQGRLAGFLRLSLPHPDAALPIPELAGQAMIREVHVYGPAVPIGEESDGEVQHSGLGSRLVQEARCIARAAGYERIAVISAIGTREYYARHGFQVDGLYMTAEV